MVRLASEEVHVEVAEIHVSDIIVAVKELLHHMKPLDLEVLVTNVQVGPAEIDASPHLASTFLRDREEGRPKAMGGL